jgi:hypothetical protein
MVTALHLRNHMLQQLETTLEDLRDRVDVARERL